MKHTTRETREQAIERMVRDGWSREFAEAFVPMTVAEATRRNLRQTGYQSELTGFVNRRRSR